MYNITSRVLLGTVFFCVTLSLFHSAPAQDAIGTGKAAQLYQRYCAGCHGKQGAGRMGLNLVDDKWKYGAGDEDLARAIRDGFPDMNKPGFGDVLSEQEIRSLVIYLRELKLIAGREEVLKRTQPKDGIFRTERHDFELETVFEKPGVIWSLDFLPDRSILATQRSGTLWHIKNATGRPVKGIPKVWDKGQGGLLEVAVHPEYSENGWIYLSYSASENGIEGITNVIRGKIDHEQWFAEEILFSPPSDGQNSGVHFGSRFVFREGFLFFSIGDRGRKRLAQEINRPNGKIYRIHDDGRIPKDNPFTDQGETARAVWSYGHRNPQGLVLHPVTGDIWESEHGPRGGDEINLIERGKNYGWPVITHGMNYSGSPITDKTSAPGMEQPEHYWTPSIAVCGIDFYKGDRFPRWKYNLFVTGLASEELHRLVIKDRKVVKDEILLKRQDRLRDVAGGPDGYLYVVFEDRAANRSRIVRLKPVSPSR